jgi:phosphoglucosamine mutase
MSIFGSSGVRDIPDRRFLQMALDIGLAVGREYRSVIVGYDTRTTGDAVRGAFTSGLLSAGCRAYDAGVLPTPVLAYAARKFDAGAMITASHNPPEYNGIKLFNPDGSSFGAEQRAKIEEKLSAASLATAPWQEVHSLKQETHCLEDYMQRVFQDFPQEIKVKVVVDCGCGAASVVTPYLLRRLGCDVISLHSYPSGHFPREIEPTVDNLSTLISVVKAVGADLGVAHDGDGDRLAVVDKKGDWVSGDKLLCLLALNCEAKKVVTTVDASLAIEELGMEVTRVRVGDAFVSEALQRGGDFGGEPSGAYIFPKVSFCPDGVYAAAAVVALASTGELSSRLEQIPSYPVLRGSIPGEKALMHGIAEKLTRDMSVPISFEDGIRLAFKDGWLLVRPSGTEPRIRVTAGARTEARARELYNLGIEAISACSSAL